MNSARDALARRCAELIDRLSDGTVDEAARDALLGDLARHQLAHVAPWRRLAEARGVDVRERIDLATLPALPTDVFRHARVAVHPPEQDVRVFRTSGTSQAIRGVHPLRDLSLYDRAARAAARTALFPDVDRAHLVVLAPPEGEAPDSSLAYMLARFAEWFGLGATDWIWREGHLDVDALEGTLRAATEARHPVALLGTSFAFVHAEDALGPRDARFALPEGSRVMHTGGFKGRSREVAPDALRDLIAARYGLPPSHVVVEYGMTELSSQMYEPVPTAPIAPEAGPPGPLWVPGWVRATPVDPDTLAPVAEGEVGVLRIDDVANLDTPCCIQTADLARRHGDRLEVLGRAPGAGPRGCSLAVDAALGGAP
ncbi:MAG: acyl-protein synthetase [Myxococcota bacterium]